MWVSCVCAVLNVFYFVCCLCCFTCFLFAVCVLFVDNSVKLNTQLWLQSCACCGESSCRALAALSQEDVWQGTSCGWQGKGQGDHTVRAGWQLSGCKADKKNKIKLRTKVFAWLYQHSCWFPALCGMWHHLNFLFWWPDTKTWRSACWSVALLLTCCTFLSHCPPVILLSEAGAVVSAAVRKSLCISWKIILVTLSFAGSFTEEVMQTLGFY